MKQNYESMSRTIEENKINYLDDLLHENFIIRPISMIFMQAMMLKIVDMIIYENPESKKKVFEIITEMYRKKYR